MKAKEILDGLREGTEHVFRLNGLPTSYQEEDLDLFEDFINELYPDEGMPSSPMIIPPFGYYLGETIVRNIPGAKWELDEPIDNIARLSISVPARNGDETARLYPFIRAQKFFQDRSDGLSVYFRGVNLMSLGFIQDKLKKNEERWVNIGTDIYRMTKLEKADD